MTRYYLAREKMASWDRFTFANYRGKESEHSGRENWGDSPISRARLCQDKSNAAIMSAEKEGNGENS